MKTDMRRELACEPFEEKIRKVGQLLRLAASMKGQRAVNRIEGRPSAAYRKRSRTNKPS
jgi:hypothetical protein